MDAGKIIGLFYAGMVIAMIFALFFWTGAMTERSDNLSDAIYSAKSFCLSSGYTKHSYGKSFGTDSGELFCINEGTGKVAETIYYYSNGKISFKELEGGN